MAYLRFGISLSKNSWSSNVVVLIRRIAPIIQTARDLRKQEACEEGEVRDNACSVLGYVISLVVVPVAYPRWILAVSAGYEESLFGKPQSYACS